MQTKNFAPKVWKRPYTSTYPINWKYGQGLYEPVVESLGTSCRGFTPSSVGSSDYSSSTLPRYRSLDRSYDNVYSRFSKSRSIVDVGSEFSRQDDFLDQEHFGFGLNKSRSMANFTMSSEDKYRRSKIEMNRLKRKREMEGALRGSQNWY